MFGDLDWEGSNGDPKKHYKTLGANTNTLFRGGLLLRTEILTYFILGGFTMTKLTLRHFMNSSLLQLTKRIWLRAMIVAGSMDAY